MKNIIGMVICLAFMAAGLLCVLDNEKLPIQPPSFIGDVDFTTHSLLV